VTHEDPTVHDRVIVRRLEEQEITKGGHHHPGHGQGESQSRAGRRRGATARSWRTGPLRKLEVRKGTAFSFPSTPEPTSRSTVRSTSSCARTMSSRSSRAKGEQPWQPKRSASTRSASADPERGEHAGQCGAGHARPRAANVVLEKSWGSPTVTKDGVTVAKEIELENRFENMGRADGQGGGVEDLRRRRRRHDHRDRLGQAIFREGLKLVAAGHNPMELKRGIDHAVARVVENLEKQSKKTRAGRTSPRSARSRPMARRRSARSSRGDGEGRQGRRDHRRGSEVDGDQPGGGRGHAVRPRLLSPYFVTDAERMEWCSRTRRS